MAAKVHPLCGECGLIVNSCDLCNEEAKIRSVTKVCVASGEDVCSIDLLSYLRQGADNDTLLLPFEKEKSSPSAETLTLKPTPSKSITQC